MAKQEQTSKKDKDKMEKGETVEVLSSDESLRKSILDATMNRYDVVVLSRRWAYELQSNEPAGLSIQDAIEHSVNDLLGGKVTPKTIKALPPFRHAKKQKGVMGFITDPLVKPIEGAPSSEALDAEGSSKKSKSEE